MNRCSTSAKFPDCSPALIVAIYNSEKWIGCFASASEADAPPRISCRTVRKVCFEEAGLLADWLHGDKATGQAFAQAGGDIEFQADGTMANSREGWREVIKRMVAAGAEGTEQDFETVFQYLSTHFPVEAQKALNLNTAMAVELDT